MSLNLAGSYFGNNDIGFNQSNRNDVMKSNAKAVLYVFSPKSNKIPDVGLRPFSYRFDDNFIHTTQEICDLSSRGGSSASSLMDRMMTQSNFNDYLVTSHSPSMLVKTSTISDHWTFILILTETPDSLSIGNTLAKSSSDTQMRRIYTGYFTDEPFNAFTSGFHKKTLNPNGYMVITHKTVVGVSTSYGRMGPQTLVDTRSSEEVIHPQLTKDLVGLNLDGSSYERGLYLMTPENCINSIETSDDGYTMVVPGAHSDISRDFGANVVSDVLEQPAHNVAQIVKGLIRYQDDVVTKNRLSTRRVSQYYEDEFLDESLARTKLSRFMSLPRSRNMSIFDLDVDSQISSCDLDSMVGGDLHVVDIDATRPMFYESADQMEISITNQFSFLIASVISPIMASAGLFEMQFEYQIAYIKGQVQDRFDTYGATGMYTLPDHDIKAMAKAVEVELVNGIFATIYSSQGDFHVSVKANATGTTFVRLSLIGQGYKNPIDFEFPSFMGGVVSPLIGDAASNAFNSEKIEQVYNVATGSFPVSSKFDEDGDTFNQYAERRVLDTIPFMDDDDMISMD